MLCYLTHLLNSLGLLFGRHFAQGLKYCSIPPARFRMGAEGTTAKTDARACDARPSSLFVFHPVRAAFGFSIVTRTLRLAAIAGCGRGSMRRHQSVHVVLFNSENRTRSAVLRLPVQSRKYTIFFWTSQLSVSSLQPQWCHVVRGMVRSLACKEGEKQNSKTDCHCVLLFGRHFAQGCG